MPRKTGPVGPFPEGADPEAYDKLRRRIFWTMSNGIYLVGSRHGEQRNLMTLNWAVQLATEPKLVGVGIENSAVTRGLIAGGRVFSLAVLAREDRVMARKFTKPAEWDPAGALNGYPVRETSTGCPVPEAAVAYLDCRVVRDVDFGSHTLFAGEVVDAAFLRDEGTPVLRMEDTRMSYGG